MARSLREGAAAAVVLAPPAPQGTSGLCSPHRVALTRRCPVMGPRKAGRILGARAGAAAPPSPGCCAFSRPRRNSSSSSPSERPRQKLSRKAASSANLLLRSGSTERWVGFPGTQPAESPPPSHPFPGQGWSKHCWAACCVPGPLPAPSDPSAREAGRRGVGWLLLSMVQVRKWAQRASVLCLKSHS